MSLSLHEQAEWHRRTAADRPEAEALADPLWRLRWLYTCLDKDKGGTVPFTPSVEQIEVIVAVHIRGWRRLIIPKARQLGMSTVICLLALDMCLWNEGYKAALVDKTQDDANTKMREKIKLPWENVGDEITSRLEQPVGYGGAERIGFRLLGTAEAPSVYEVGVNFRGGTVQFLHLSEWGWIQAHDSTRSEGILTGALPAVELAEDGVCVIETTWEGGKTGHVWPFVDEALTTPERLKGPKSWRCLFFGWHTCTSYTQEHGHVDAESGNYLAQKEQELGIRFTDGQKQWYAEKRRTMGAKVLTEYPTVIDECWSAPVAGAVYADEINSLRGRSMVSAGEWDRQELVHTFWDLGAPKNTAIWYMQFVGREIHCIDHDEGLDLTTPQRVAHMLAKGYSYGKHWLPHDAGATQKGGLNFISELTAAGLANCRTVPRTAKVRLGVDRAHGMLSRCWFRVPQCNLGLAALEAYHWKTDSQGNVIGDEPVHDWSSHSADAFRTMAEAVANGLLKIGAGGASGMREDAGSGAKKTARKVCRFEMS